MATYFSQDDRLDIANKITQLPGPALKRVMEIVKQDKEKVIKRTAGDEFSFDVKKMNNTVLLTLQRFVYGQLGKEVPDDAVSGKLAQTISGINVYSIIDEKNTQLKYRCGKCSKRFRTRTEVIVHIRTHTGEKPYKCKHCNKTFACPSNKRVHEVKHKKLKRFACEYPGCGKKFSHAVTLREHRDIHFGVDYHCPSKSCDKVFPAAHLVKRHMNTHHPGEYQQHHKALQAKRMQVLEDHGLVTKKRKIIN